MAKQRIINTKFWDDSYISELDPIEKLLFLYLLTNPLTNIAGFYEIKFKRIAFDTGIERDMVSKILARFEKDKKVIYFSEYDFIWIPNFIRHQTLNEKVKEGILRIWKEDVPKPIISMLLQQDKIDYDRLSIEHIYTIILNLTKLNLTKPNLITSPTDMVNGNSLFNNCRNFFINYTKMNVSTDYQFSAKEGKQLKNLLSKIKISVNKKVVNATETDYENAFKYIVSNCNDNWVKDNWEITTFVNKYNPIIQKLKNGTNKGYNHEIGRARLDAAFSKVFNAGKTGNVKE